MSEYAKEVKVLEGPWERNAFPNGEETTNVLNRKIITQYVRDGYLCEKTVTREYKGNDYFDTTSTKRIIKLDNNQ
jgi:hypothetical protein